jgi:hypothetical protein
MADEKRKGGGAKTSRSETVTVRLDPRTRYLAEVAARAQRRTLSSFLEESARQSADTTLLGDRNGVPCQLHEVADKLWDVDPMDRFVKLAMNFPHLLDYEEQKLWKFVLETFAAVKDRGKFNASLDQMEALRKHGGLFQTAAGGNFVPSEMARALNGDMQMMDLIVHMHEASQGPFATEHPDTTAEREAAKKTNAAAKKSKAT